MRRKDRQCNDPAFFDHVFNTAEALCLALRDGGFPYCLYLNFVRKDNVIYIHSAREGHKLDLLRANGNAAFALACDIRIDRQKSATYYASVQGRAHGAIVDDIEEKRAALDMLSARYEALCPRPASDANVARVAIIRLDILEMAGKRCAPAGSGAPGPV